LPFAALAVAAMVLAIACGDDDVAPIPPFDGGDTGAATGDAAPASEAAADAAADAPVVDAPAPRDAPGDDVEAATRQDAAKIEPDAACKSSNPCDCDNDGYQSLACDASDCDDRDPLVHPNQTYVAEPPPPPNQGNWDCTGGVEKQYTFNLTCATLPLGLSCNTAEGFVGDPACGEVADYYRCKQAVLSCTAEKVGERRQGCR
jgi:hypothetical protein